jgi:16S rRNA G966 N2-methylase RsmD
MIFLDPPYDMGLTAEAMALLSVHRLDGPETVVVVEHSKREVLSSVEIGGFEVASEKRYGDTFVTLLEKENGTRRSF